MRFDDSELVDFENEDLYLKQRPKMPKDAPRGAENKVKTEDDNKNLSQRVSIKVFRK